MKIGILCAGDREVAPFLPMLSNAKTSEKSMLTIYEGKLAGADVAVLYSGVCKVNAAIAAQVLIGEYGCEAIINAGTAGAMDEALAIFDTVVGTEYAYHDVAAHILTEFHPWLEAPLFAADKALLEVARCAADGEERIHFGRMVTGEQFITDEGRESINARFHPLCVDMESAAVAHVCHVNRVPFLAVRTMTDTPSHAGVGAFEENCAKASSITSAFVCNMLEILRRDKL